MSDFYIANVIMEISLIYVSFIGKFQRKKIIVRQHIKLFFFFFFFFLFIYCFLGFFEAKISESHGYIVTVRHV